MIRALLSVSLSLVSVRGQCLRDVQVSSSSSTTVTLAWAYTCNVDDIETYKIDFKHEKFKACDYPKKDNKKPSGFGTVETQSQGVVIRNLHPYSEYSFEVRVILQGVGSGRPESLSVTGDTEFSIPKVRAQVSQLDYSYRNTKSSLVFNWSPPLAAGTCDTFYAELGNFVYVIQGINEWNRKFYTEDSLDLSQTMVEVKGLQPYSDYIFFLYISNTAGEYDEDVYLKLEGRTLSTVPDPPTLLSTDSSDSTSIHFTWKPHLPLTGNLVYYEVRWKLVSGLDWLDSRRLSVADTEVLCSDEGGKSVDLACYTLTNLTPENYTLQVRSHNENVTQPSPWSRPAHVQVREVGSGYFDATNIIIITCFVILLLASLGFLLYRFQCSRRKKGFDQVLTDDTSRPIIRGSGRQSTKFSDSNSYVLRPGSTQRCVQDPLPPVPSQENIYSDIKPKPGKVEPELEEEEDHYLKPNPARVESCESLDEQGYLRPNFNRFQRLDTSGSEHSPHVIPPVSYRTGT